MRSTMRTAVVILVAIPVAAVPALATPRGPKREGAPPGADASRAPDLHRWRLSRNGFGELKVGLTRAKIERRAGRSLKFIYRTGSCAIWTIPGVRGLSIMTTRGRLARVHAEMGTWRTSRGVQLGDSASKVRSRYPRIRTRRHEYDPGGHYLIVPGAHRRVVFETDAGHRVTAFRGGRVPEVMYVEGCA
jgi:hypothetical protein